MPMHARDERILHHVGLYRLSLRAILAKRFFDGRTAGNVIARLIEHGRLQGRPGLPERLSYYQLTAAEARRRGLPAARARPLGAQALHTHLGVLWFCCAHNTKTPRRRLDRRELAKHFDATLDNAPHCLEAGDDPVVWRVHVTSTRSNDLTLIKHLSARLVALSSTQAFGPWIEAGRYAVAILAESPGRRARLTETINRHGHPQRLRWTVEHAPSPNGLGAALRAGVT